MKSNQAGRDAQGLNGVKMLMFYKVMVARKTYSELTKYFLHCFKHFYCSILCKSKYGHRHIRFLDVILPWSETPTCLVIRAKYG